MNKYLNRYIGYLDVEKGYSKHTIKTYTLILQNFLTFLTSHKIKLKKTRKDAISRYILMLRTEKMNSSKTIRLKIDALRSFFSYLTRETRLFSRNPLPQKDFKYKVEQKEITSICAEQIEELLGAVEKQKTEVLDDLGTTTGKTVLWQKRLFAAVRDSVILKLLLSTGLRISEALNIQYGDIDFENKTIQVLGKGKKYRQVFFDLEEVEPGFLEYVHKRKTLETDHEYIFVSIKSFAKLSVRGFQTLLKNYVTKAGLSPSITPHVLRHSFASICIEKGANIKAVSQILGHASCKITIDTYTHLSSSHIREVMQRCNPLSTEVIPLEERIEGRKKYLAYFEKTG